MKHNKSLLVKCKLEFLGLYVHNNIALLLTPYWLEALLLHYHPLEGLLLTFRSLALCLSSYFSSDASKSLLSKTMKEESWTDEVKI